MKHLHSGTAPMLIDITREVLNDTELPWIIENVEGAPLETATNLFGDHGVFLCGTMFNLRVYRHRLFETSFPLQPPSQCNHHTHAMNPHNAEGRRRMYEEFGRSDPEKIWRDEMGVRWMDKKTGRQAIPPAYTKFIGEQLIHAIEEKKRPRYSAG